MQAIFGKEQEAMHSQILTYPFFHNFSIFYREGGTFHTEKSVSQLPLPRTQNMPGAIMDPYRRERGPDGQDLHIALVGDHDLERVGDAKVVPHFLLQSVEPGLENSWVRRVGHKKGYGDTKA